MKIENKIALAFVALMFIMGMSANTNRASRLAKAYVMGDSVSGDTNQVKDEPVLNEGSVVDEVIWVVGDEPILKSDVEVTRLQGEAEGIKYAGDPDCSIPEQIAVQKLFLHQAAIDSIEVTDAQISAGVDRQIDYMISVVGSREKLEEYHKKTMTQIRNELRDSYRENQMVEEMKQQLVKDIAVTPAEVRRYFKDMPTDSIPFVPTEVEVQIITQTPRVSQEEINRVKGELRDYTDRINRGDASFQTLARLCLL